MHREARIALGGTVPIALAVFAVASTCQCLLLHATWMTIAIAGLTGALTIEFLAPDADPAGGG
jgi:hypothetical protein